jgi:hypothetical protein
MIARGQLFHHFHGTYSASLLLVFASKDEATKSLAILGDGWKPAAKEPCAVLSTLSSDELDAFKARHEKGLAIKPCGRSKCRSQCAHQAIDGVPHSVDVGPEFTLTLDES